MSPLLSFLVFGILLYLIQCGNPSSSSSSHLRLYIINEKKIQVCNLICVEFCIIWSCVFFPPIVDNMGVENDVTRNMWTSGCQFSFHHSVKTGYWEGPTLKCNNAVAIMDKYLIRKKEENGELLCNERNLFFLSVFCKRCCFYWYSDMTENQVRTWGWCYGVWVPHMLGDWCTFQDCCGHIQWGGGQLEVLVFLLQMDF